MCIAMASSNSRVIAVLPDSLEAEFRQLAMKKFGMKRGYLKKAFTEAVETWVKLEKEKGKVK
jgi:hypothetical protein